MPQPIITGQSGLNLHSHCRTFIFSDLQKILPVVSRYVSIFSIHCLILYTMLCSPAMAGDCTDHSTACLTIGMRLRSDDLRWSEASGSINIASELSWEKLGASQLFSSLQFQSGDNWIFEATGAAGYIQSGSNQDSDYNGNNRTLEYSRSVSQAHGELLDFSVGLGNAFDCPMVIDLPACSVTPLLGYALNQQHLDMTDGYQLIPASGAFPGLHNRYNTLWQGPWLAIQTQFLANKQWSIIARLA